MNVRNCRKCGRLFNYALGPIICPACKEQLDGKFKEVKEYIQKHPGCGMNDVARDCEVETQQIQQWLREERLEFTTDSMVQLSCESCGTQIRSGRYCDKCKANLANGFQRAIQPQRQAQPEAKKTAAERDNKMRFL